MTKQERQKAAQAAPEAQERIDERLPLSPDGMPDYPGQGAPEAQERIDERLPPRTPFAASGAVPEMQGPSGGPDAERGWITREYPDNPALTVTVSKPPSQDVVEGTYMRRTKPLYGEFGQDQDMEPVRFRRARPMSMREAADAGLFQDSTPRGVEMDPADKVRAGFMRPFAERGQEARPGVTTGQQVDVQAGGAERGQEARPGVTPGRQVDVQAGGAERGQEARPGVTPVRQVDEILQRLERAREMDNKQMDVQAGGAGEQFRRGLNETRDLRWGASGPTSAVNRAIAERRGRGEQTDEAIRLAKEAPPPRAGAAKPLTPNQAGALMMRRASLLQGDGVTPLRPEALEEARKIDELLSEGGYGGGAAGKEKPGEGGAAGYKQGDVRMINGKRHVRDAKGNWKPE
jgi:hypothetical protein